MSLNIKNPHTHELVRRLADLTGQTQTGAVEDAVARRLAEVESGHTGATIDARWAQVEQILVEFRADVAPEERSRILHGSDDLYDDLGLPR
jgi:antitoxin VapB